MSHLDRRILSAVALTLGLVLCGCSSSSEFDPSSLIPDNLFGMGKKPLPGDRRAVFPEGVPGVSQGVPPQLMKGHQQAEDTEVPASEPVQTAKPAKPTKSAATQPAKPKPKKASAPAAQPAAAAPAQSGQPAASPWPDPPAQNPWPQSSTQNAWPPPSSNTFSR